MQKKVLWSSIIVLGLILIAVAFVFWLKANNLTTETQKVESTLNNTVGVKDCSLYKDVSSVVVKGDMKGCDCLADTSKVACRQAVSDNLFYVQAFSQSNPALCEKISAADIKAGCSNMINKKIIATKNGSPDSLLDSYMQSNNYVAALDLLKGLLVKDPTNIFYLNSAAIANAAQALVLHKEAELIPTALSFVEKAKKLDPNNPEVYRTEGYVYEIKPDIAKAIASYNQALKIDPNYILVYVGRGHAKELGGDAQGAAEDYDTAASLDKKQENIAIYSRLCQLNLSFAYMDEAIKNCGIVTNSPLSGVLDKAQAYQMLGSIYSNLGQDDKALTQLKIAETYLPNDVNLMIGMAMLYLNEGNYVLAENYSNKAVLADPQRAVPYEKLAGAFLGQKKYQEAVTNSLKAISLVDNDVSILLKFKRDVKYRIYVILSKSYSGLGDNVNRDKYENLIKSL